MFARQLRTAVTAVTMVVIASSVASGAVAAAADPDGAFGTQSGPAQYVVVFDQDIAAGIAAVEEAGGEVMDLTEPLNVALVTAEDVSFLDEVRAADAVSRAMRNHPVATLEPGQADLVDEDWMDGADQLTAGADTSGNDLSTSGRTRSEPLADLQWGMDMIGATPEGAHGRATGQDVSVGIIDTGIDASHPDIAPNFDQRRSRNFVMDIPEIDGPCETPTCIDPSDVDHNGHGTHMAGTVGAARDNFGIGGVAPDATLVSLRAGQDSGYAFLYAMVAALVEAGDLRLDVVNISIYLDPWYYNCASHADYIDGEVSDEELAEQAMIRDLVSAGLDYAHDRGVTLVAAAGNVHADLAAPERSDELSPSFPPGSERPRTVTSNCLNMPAEGPHVITVSAVGPSSRKADYSNYGLGSIDISGPGGWTLDFIGTPRFGSPGNRVLSSFPLDVALEAGLVDENLQPTNDLAVTYCDRRGTCGVYFYAQGTSMASPHVAGVAALIVERHGSSADGGGQALDPDVVAEILRSTATDQPCPAAGFEDYTPEGRPPEWNAVCEGTTDNNGLYGEGIVSAVDAVQHP